MKLPFDPLGKLVAEKVAAAVDIAFASAPMFSQLAPEVKIVTAIYDALVEPPDKKWVTWRSPLSRLLNLYNRRRQKSR